MGSEYGHLTLDERRRMFQLREDDPVSEEVGAVMHTWMQAIGGIEVTVTEVIDEAQRIVGNRCEPATGNRD